MPTDPSTGGQENSAFAEFLDDYFIECDEHLAGARRSVLALEPLLQNSTADPVLLDELFRSFHSLKGLSAMVGFHEAEQLAHHLESFLSAVRKKQVRLELAGLETLVAGIATLEKIIAARRDAAPGPDTEELVALVDSLLSAASGRAADDAGLRPSPSKSGDQHARLADKIRQGATAWKITFRPSAELVEQGVDVNAVRQRLQALGELVHSEPVVDAAGRIAFNFTLLADGARVNEELQGNGLTCEEYQPDILDRGPPTLLPVTAPESELSTHLTPANVVRVDLGRLDELMRIVGELVLSRARLDDGLRRLKGSIPEGELRWLLEINSAIERQLRDLRDGVMHVRMVPVREVFARMRFVVRDMMRELGKKASLRLSGEETQIDKYVVERIMDPLLHLVRNAVSHGLESAKERLAAGKPAEGRIDLRARTTGENVSIEVEDDGRGIDAQAILAQARERGFDLSPTLPHMEPVLETLCRPGFSTRDQADRASGRGVGMDVVRRAVEEMGGSLSLDTALGRGTKFVIQLPLTLAITDALIVKVAEQQFAVPQVAVREVVRSEPNTAISMENNELLRYHGGVIPLLRLSALLGNEASRQDSFYTLVTGEGAQTVGLVVDRVLGLREVVVRPLTDRLVKVPGIAGATELGDGKVVLILDVAHLFRYARHKCAGPLPAPPLPVDATRRIGPAAKELR